MGRAASSRRSPPRHREPSAPPQPLAATAIGGRSALPEVSTRRALRVPSQRPAPRGALPELSPHRPAGRTPRQEAPVRPLRRCR